MFSAIRRRCHGLGDDDRAQLDVPAQHDLGRRAAVLAARSDDHRVGEQLAALGQRAPRLGRDAGARRRRPGGVLLEVGVQLDLVDRRAPPRRAVEELVAGGRARSWTRRSRRTRPSGTAPPAPARCPRTCRVPTAAASGSGRGRARRSRAARCWRRRRAGWRRTRGRRSTPCWSRRRRRGPGRTLAPLRLRLVRWRRASRCRCAGSRPQRRAHRLLGRVVGDPPDAEAELRDLDAVVQHDGGDYPWRSSSP